MPKRIALFILGVVLAIGAFILYQFVSGTGSSAPKKVKLAPSTASAQPLPMTIEERDANGRLIYLITAPKAPEPMKDAAGNILPGQFHIGTGTPEGGVTARFYDKGGRMYQVEADNCDIAVAGMPGTGTGGAAGATGGLGGGMGALTGGGKSTIKLDQIVGSLYGHARMSMGAKVAGKNDKDPFNNGVRIYFDEKVKLDGASQQLKSDGALHIRSDTIEADQKGLTAVFDQKSRHILSLNIGENPNGNQIIVRGMADKAMQMMDQKEKPPTTAAGGGNVQVTPPATQVGPQKEKEEVPIYRLTFGQDVLAKAGVSSLASQNLALIFSPTQTMLGNDATKPAATATAPAVLPLNAANPGIESIPLEVKPIQPPDAKDLVITWAGPLEMLPVDPKEFRPLAPDEIILDAVGTALKPVTVKKDPTEKEAGFETILGKLQYDTGHPILLLPEEYKKVLLRRFPAIGSGGLVSDVDCGKVTITQIGDKHYAAELLGPGILTDQRNEKAKDNGKDLVIKSVVKWNHRMLLDLVPDPADPKGKDMVVRSAEFDGAYISQDGPKAIEMTAATMNLLLAYAKPKESDKNKEMALEHMLATGDVKIYRKGIKPEDQGELFADRLEIISTPGTAGKLPAISQMLADGNVASWRYAAPSAATRTATTVAAIATAPATALAAANPADNYRKEKLSAGSFAASLIAKPKTTTAPATGPAAQNALDALAGSFDVDHFVAQQNVKLEVIPPVHSRREILTVSGDTIESSPIKGASVITAARTADGQGGVRVTSGTDLMVSSRIELQKFDKDKDTYYEINSPGPGTFHFTVPPSKTQKQPMPMDISWQTKMNYDGENEFIVFDGKPVARSPGKFEDQAYLACEKTLTIKLRKVDKKDAAADSEFGSFDIDWMQAVGKVDARGATYDATDKLLSRVRLSGTESLKYTKANPDKTTGNADDGDLINIPGEGFMIIEDYRPEKSNAQFSSNGETYLHWTGDLTRDAKGTINISRDVLFLFRPTKSLKFASGLTAGAAAQASDPTKKTYIRLNAEKLTAIPMPPDPKEKKKDDPINIGSMQIATVDAGGGPILQMGNWTPPPDNVFDAKPVILVNGTTMHVDVPHHTALVKGSSEDRVSIDHLIKNDHVSGKSVSIDTANGDLTIEDLRVISGSR